MAKAELARFYGWLPWEVDALTVDEFQSYQQALVILEAKEKLSEFEVIDYPNLKDSARLSTFNRYKKRLEEFKSKDTQKKGLSNEEIFKMISGRL